jgi:hypothetical protein
VYQAQLYILATTQPVGKRPDKLIGRRRKGDEVKAGQPMESIVRTQDSLDRIIRETAEAHYLVSGLVDMLEGIKRFQAVNQRAAALGAEIKGMISDIDDTIAELDDAVAMVG